MKSLHGTLTLCLLLFLCVVQETMAGMKWSPRPIWPSTFQARFESTWKNTTGIFIVKKLEDGSRAEKIVFKDGSKDHLCAHSHLNQRCEQLTTDGYRYLHFPSIKDCCKCCSYKPGDPYACGGPLTPNWVSNGEYLGEEEVWAGFGVQVCHKWAVVGLSKKLKNYYFQNADTLLPCEVDGYNYLFNDTQRADDQYIFDPETISLKVDSAEFTVPSYCANARPCGNPVCDPNVNAPKLNGKVTEI